MLSTRLQGMVRQRVEQNLTQSCTIERPDWGTDEYGGRVELPPATSTSDCFLTRKNRSSADMINAADMGRVFYMLHLPWDADIEDGDVVVIDDERYRVEQAIRQQSVQVMRQAVVVLQGS